jgi:hypothetical protein
MVLKNSMWIHELNSVELEQVRIAYFYDDNDEHLDSVTTEIPSFE